MTTATTTLETRDFTQGSLDAEVNNDPACGRSLQRTKLEGEEPFA